MVGEGEKKIAEIYEILFTIWSITQGVYPESPSYHKKSRGSGFQPRN